MTLIKREGSNNWYAKIYVSPKRQLWRCLYTTKQKEAQALHDQLESQVKAERREQKIAKIFTSTAQIASGAARVPLGEIIKKTKQIKELNEDAISATLRFIEWLRASRPDIVHAAQIERAVALSYMQASYGVASPKTFNNVRSMLSSVFRSLAVYEIKNPFEGLPHKATNSLPYRAFSREETTRILKAAGDNWKLMIQFALYTGLRKKDIVFMRWDSVKNEYIELVPAKTARNRKAVWIPMHENLKAVLLSLKREGDFVFPDDFRRQYDTGVFNAAFPHILAVAKVNDNEHGKASFHSLRSTFITRCEEANIPRHVIQGIVGHNSPHMTERYSHDHESAKAIRSVAF